MSRQVTLIDGPQDGLNVTSLCGNEIHFFVLDRRSPVHPVLSYYFREPGMNLQDFRHEPIPPNGAVGRIIVIG